MGIRSSHLIDYDYYATRRSEEQKWDVAPAKRAQVVKSTEIYKISTINCSASKCQGLIGLDVWSQKWTERMYYSRSN